MDDQLAYRVLSVDFHYYGKFVLRRNAEAGLDGYLQFTAGEDICKAVVERTQVEQHTRALVLCNHRARRTPDIQIDLAVAHVCKLARNGEKRLRRVAEYLRHERDFAIVLRKNVAQIAGLEFTGAVRRDKGGVVFVGTAEHFTVCAAENIRGDTLKRSKA